MQFLDRTNLVHISHAYWHTFYLNVINMFVYVNMKTLLCQNIITKDSKNSWNKMKAIEFMNEMPRKGAAGH